MNTLILPSTRGDPLTCFDIDEISCYCICGTASGQIGLWRMDHIQSIIYKQQNNSNNFIEDIDDQKENHVQNSHSKLNSHDETNQIITPKKPSGVSQTNQFSGPLIVRCDLAPSFKAEEFICRLLSSVSDEGVRSVYFDKKIQKLIAVIGDLHLKVWKTSIQEPSSVNGVKMLVNKPLFDSTSVDILKFQRQHTYQICSSTYTLTHNEHILLIKPPTNNGSGDCLIQHIDIQTMQQTTLSLSLDKSDVPISFDERRLVVLHTDENGIKVVKIFDWQKPPYALLYTLTFTKKHKHYWGFQLFKRTLIYVCCQTKIKMINLPPLLDSDNSSHSETTKIECRPILPSNLKFKIRAATHRILSFLVVDEETVIVLTDDRKIKFFANGQLKVKYTNIKGIFRFNYPYILKLFHSRLYYSADDGIYVLQCIA